MPHHWGKPFFAVIAAGYVAALVVAARVMPDPTPSHYDGLGRPDDWSSRASMVAFWAIAGAVILGGGWALSRIRMHSPTHVNMPAASKEYWFANDERRATFWGIFADTMLALVAWTGALMVVLMLGSAFSARAGSDLPAALTFGSVAIYLLAVLWCCVALMRRTRPPTAQTHS